MTETKQTSSLLDNIAPLLVIGAGICWGCIGIFIRPLEAAGFSSFQLIFVRSSLASLIMLAICLVHNPSILRIRLRDLWCFLGTGLIGVVFFSACYYTTISMTTLSVAAVLMYTAPVFVVLLSRPLFGESITPRKLVAVVLTIIGCVYVSGMLTEAPQISPLGLLIGIGSGIGYASYSIFSRFALQRGYQPLAIATWTFIFATIGSLFLANPVEIVGQFVAQPSALWPALGLAVVNAVAAYELYTTGLAHMENGRASVIVSIETVVATLTGVFVFNEVFTWYNALGIALVLTAVALLGLSKTPINSEALDSEIASDEVAPDESL